MSCQIEPAFRFVEAATIHHRIREIVQAPALWANFGWSGGALAALGHRDIDVPDFALRADLHRLLVAGRPQRHAGGKSRSLDEYLNLAAACGA